MNAVEVAVVGLRGLPNVIGGVESHCAELYPRMAKLMPGVRFRIYARSQFVDPTVRQFGPLLIEPIDAPDIRRVEPFIHTLKCLLHARFSTRARIIHIHGIGPNFWTPLARLLGMSVVATHHSRDYRRPDMSRLSRAILLMGEFAAATCANRLIAVSRPILGHLTGRFPWRSAKMQWIPNGVKDLGTGSVVPVDERALLASLGVKPGEYVLSVSRIDPGKDLDTLVLAMQRSGIDKKLVIVGSAHQHDAYAEQLRAKAGDRVVFAGYRSHKEVIPLYRNASLFVLPSLNEGLSIAVLEAIACNVPIIISDIEANVALDLGKDNYFPAGDVESLARALQRPHASYRFGNAFFLEHFNWDRIAEETAIVFRTVLRDPQIMVRAMTETAPSA